MLKPAALILASFFAAPALAQTEPGCDWQTLATIPGETYSGARVGQTLWLLQSENDRILLRSFDLTDPANPAMLSSTPFADLAPGSAANLGSAGTLLFAFDSNTDTTYLIDAADPAHPRRRATLNVAPLSTFPNTVHWHATDELLALVSRWSNQALIFDIRDPDAPRELYRSPLRVGSVAARPLAISGPFVYLLNTAQPSGYRLETFDTRSTPPAVRTVDLAPFPGLQVSVHAVDDRLIVASSHCVAFDLTNPALPVQTDHALPPLLERLTNVHWDHGPRGILTSGPMVLLEPGTLTPTTGMNLSRRFTRAWQFEGAFAGVEDGVLKIVHPDAEFAPAVRGTVESSYDQFIWRRGRPIDITLDMVNPSGCTYTWRLAGSDAVTTTEPALHLEPRFSLAIQIRVDITNACGSFSFWIQPVNCTADFNADDFIDSFDYIDFVDAFESGDPSADVSTDGFLDFFDYDEFIGLFERGCGVF